MNRSLESSRWQLALRVLAPLVLGILAASITQPVFAQKQVFVRQKPHVNVSGAEFEMPEILYVEPDSTAARPAGGGGVGGDIIVFDIVDSVAIESPQGSLALVIYKSLELADDIIVVAGDVWDLTDETATDVPLASSGYIRVKKLNTGG